MMSGAKRNSSWVLPPSNLSQLGGVPGARGAGGTAAASGGQHPFQVGSIMNRTGSEQAESTG